MSKYTACAQINVANSQSVAMTLAIQWSAVIMKETWGKSHCNILFFLIRIDLGQFIWDSAYNYHCACSACYVKWSTRMEMRTPQHRSEKVSNWAYSARLVQLRLGKSQGFIEMYFFFQNNEMKNARPLLEWGNYNIFINMYLLIV